MRKIVPFRILQKCGHNASKVELPPDIGLSNTFNVSYLYPYRGSQPKNSGIESTKVDKEIMDSLPKVGTPTIECVLEKREGKKTRRKVYIEYLIKWIGKLVEDASWLPESAMKKMGYDVSILPTQET